MFLANIRWTIHDFARAPLPWVGERSYDILRGLFRPFYLFYFCSCHLADPSWIPIRCWPLSIRQINDVHTCGRTNIFLVDGRYLGSFPGISTYSRCAGPLWLRDQHGPWWRSDWRWGAAPCQRHVACRVRLDQHNEWAGCLVVRGCRSTVWKSTYRVDLALMA